MTWSGSDNFPGTYKEFVKGTRIVLPSQKSQQSSVAKIIKQSASERKVAEYPNTEVLPLFSGLISFTLSIQALNFA